MGATIEASAGTGGRARLLLASMRERWSGMQPAQRRVLLLSVLALLALSCVSMWWSTRTDWRTLFSGMDGRDAAAMQQQLATAGILYQTTPDGTAVQVPAEQLDKARVAISAGGLPQSGRLGFELFDKPNWIGSEFDEKVNFQRALEGELERTIGSLEAVRNARVHLVLARQGAFASEDQPAKASAVLKLRRANLPREQTEAIRNLIAGSVEGLRPEAVTLVDADGRTDLSPNSRSGQDREQEIALQNKLIQVLEPLAGAGNVHATVSMVYVQGSEEHTDEVYDPQSAVPVTTQKTEQSSQAVRPGGVAGASANTPAAQPAPAAAGASGAAPAVSVAVQGNAGQTQTSREESSSYAVNRHVTHTEEAPGRIQRLTAAIVINDRESRETAGKTVHTVWQHRSPEEMKRMQQLAQAAVGFDDKRGDQVVLENISFSGNEDAAPAAGFARVSEGVRDVLRSQPALPRTLATGLALLMLGLLVLRPLTRQAEQLLTPVAAALPAPSAPVAVLAPAPVGAAEQALPPAAEKPVETGGAPFSTQQIFDRVTEQIKAEPQNGTRLIGSWILAGVEEES